MVTQRSPPFLSEASSARRVIYGWFNRSNPNRHMASASAGTSVSRMALMTREPTSASQEPGKRKNSDHGVSGTHALRGYVRLSQGAWARTVDETLLGSSVTQQTAESRPPDSTRFQASDTDPQSDTPPCNESISPGVQPCYLNGGHYTSPTLCLSRVRIQPTADGRRCRAQQILLWSSAHKGYNLLLDLAAMNPDKEAKRPRGLKTEVVNKEHNEYRGIFPATYTLIPPA